MVEKFATVGINNHLLCYLIEHTHQVTVVCISKLVDPRPFTAHMFRGDGGKYIAFQWYIENTFI